MSERLEFAFTPDPEREAAARWRWVVMPVRGIVAGLVGLFGLFVLAVHLLIGRFTPLAIAGLVLLVVGLGLLGVWRVRNRQAVGTRRTKVVLDGRGIATHAAEGTATLAWERFERWLENDDEFVVLSRVEKARGVVVLPKDGLSEDEQEAVRELLVERIESGEEPLDDAFVEEDEPGA